MRDAARVHDGDVPAARDLRVPVAEQALAHGLRVRVRDLAAQEPDGEGRHRRTSLVPLRENVCRPALELEPVDVVPAERRRSLGGQVAGRHDLPRAPRRSSSSSTTASSMLATATSLAGNASSRTSARETSIGDAVPARRLRPPPRQRPRRDRPPGPARTRAARRRPRRPPSRSRRRGGFRARAATGARCRPASSGAPPVPNARPGSTTTAARRPWADRSTAGRSRGHPPRPAGGTPSSGPPSRRATGSAVACGNASTIAATPCVRDVHGELGRIAVRRSPRSLPVHARRATRARSRPRPSGRRRRRGGGRSAERALQAAEEAAVLVARPVRVVVELLVQLLDESALLRRRAPWAPRRRGARSSEPRPEPRSAGIPSPRRTRTSPGCVPGGTSSATSPESDVTVAVVPSAASVIVRRRRRVQIVAVAHEARDPAGRGRRRTRDHGRCCEIRRAPGRARGSAGRRGSPSARRPRAARRRHDTPVAATVGARLLEHLAGALALGTRPLLDELAEHALRDAPHDPGSRARRAAPRRRLRLGARSVAARARDARHRAARSRSAPANASSRSISTTTWTSPPRCGRCRRSSAEQVLAEEGGEDVGDAAEVRERRSRTRPSGARPCRTGRTSRAARGRRAPRTPRRCRGSARRRPARPRRRDGARGPASGTRA